MQRLFKTSEQNLQSSLERKTPKDVEGIVGYSTFYKGKDYFENDLVRSVHYDSARNSLSAVVEGTRNYSVVVSLHSGRVTAQCSCPVD
ncbi:MAG: hypothetical protein U1C46_04210 [Bacteroidales bacterium]|nr:hypothetical protein [Bacteroidales bacterium]MDZ4204007.1 hypothetical protein [Bacteroidales bacterium]